MMDKEHADLSCKKRELDKGLKFINERLEDSKRRKASWKITGKKN